MRQVEVYLSEFKITVSADGQIVRQIEDLSIGRAGHLTPMFEDGALSPREALHISSKYPPPHGGAEMPFALFFEKAGRADLAGCAFHQGDTFAPSHGCIHLNKADAQWLFNWAGSLPVRVSVHGPYPSSPVRAHIYEVGAAAMLPRVVRRINERLSQLGLLSKTPDEIYDQKTADAVRKFQEQKGLAVDGKVGEHQTAGALGLKL